MPEPAEGVQAVTWAEVSRLLARYIPDVLIFDLTDPGESRIFLPGS